MRFGSHAKRLATVGLMVALYGCAISSQPLPVDDPVARIRASNRPTDEKLRDLEAHRRAGEIGESDYQKLRSELIEQL